MLTIALAVDLALPPRVQLSQRVLVLGLRLHRVSLARWLGSTGVQCRFEPTCSHYAEACLRELGTARASWWVGRRLLRCGPWTPEGTVDLPPGREPPGSATACQVVNQRLYCLPSGARAPGGGAS